MVLDKAAELAIALSQSDEFRKFVEAKKNLEDDAFSANLLYNYSYAENQLADLISADDGDEEEIKIFVDVMRDLKDQIVHNRLISRMIIAQNAFQSLMDQINMVVEKYVFDEVDFGDEDYELDDEPKYMN